MSNFLTPQPSPDRNKYAITPIDNLMSDAEWNFSQVDPSDIVEYENYPGVSVPYISLTLNPITASTRASYISKVGSPNAPCEIRSNLAVQYRDQRTTPYLVAYDDSNTRTGYTQQTINVTALNQATTTLTVTLAEPFDYSPGTLFSIEDCTDTRFNYLMCNVSWISEDKLSIQTTTQCFDTLPSITATATTAVLRIYPDALLNYADGAGFIFSGTSSTGAELLNRTNGNSYYIGQAPSVIGGNRRASISSTNPAITGYGDVDIRYAPTEYRLDIESSAVNFYDRGINTNTGAYASRGFGNVNHPTLNRRYKTSLGVVREIDSYTRPVANITAISRTSNVVTITLDRTASSAGITTASYLQVYGVRDQTNFVNINFSSTLPTSVTGNTITIAWTGTNATSYGGSISIVHGQIVQPQLSSQVIQTVEIVNPNLVRLTGNASWGTIAPGDVVYVTGALDSTGASLGIDGFWKVGRVSATLCALSPIVDRLGTRRSPTVAALAATPAGGSIIWCTRIMISSYVSINKSIQEMRISGQGTTNHSNSIPVNITSGGVSAAQGTAATSTNGTTGWPFSQGYTFIEDRASSALTATATGSALTVMGSSGVLPYCSLSLIVTAVSGTSPTLDVSIEYQENSGAAWTKIYDFPRITSAGTYRTPILPLQGRFIRYVYTVAGTSPSFTFSVQRYQYQYMSVPAYVQCFDRTLSLTTANAATAALYTPNCSVVNLVLYVPSAGTLPAVKLQQSDDNGVTWYDASTPLVAVAGTPVVLRVPDIMPTHIRAVVSTAGATVGAGYYVLLKASGH
jgi:hypothetical protein